MTSASLDLQKSLYLAVKSDAAITSLLGGPKIFDDVPQRTDYPYITFGQSLVRDWSTGGEDGHEHLVTLHVWSRAAGRKEASEILAAIESALHDQALTLADHHLVNLRHEYSDVRRDPDGETFHGLARFRAVTEVGD
ncbi:MAG: DUF3168 domain-containing protein [Hyphomicrobiaceae bacterium]|nr:DUF3168 domain-containing protein [Hyphomicrobiaceae bacterium]